MKIVENNVECDETVMLDHKFYLKTTKFPSDLGILSKNFVPEWGFRTKNLVVSVVFFFGGGGRWLLVKVIHVPALGISLAFILELADPLGISSPFRYQMVSLVKVIQFGSIPF